MIQLYDYQNNGVVSIRNEYKSGSDAVLYVLPTGGGKTVVFSHIAMKTAGNGKRVWILVHRVELLRQISKALRGFGVRHGLVNPNYTPDLIAPVQIASVQTLVNRIGRMPGPDLIIIDEAHHATAGSWRKIIAAYPGARVLGVTATPKRADGKGLGKESGGVFDTMIIGPQIPELIEMGFLAKPIIYARTEPIDLDTVKIVNHDYDKTAIDKLVDRPIITGDAVSHYQEICDGVPAVAFCSSIAHAEHVAHEFRKSGYSAYSVDGKMDDDTRARILDGLGDGSIQIVTSCDLISEGTDIPAIGCAILLRPTLSVSLYLQQVGRALRVSPGKTHAIILDHVGNVMNHGLPDAERDWKLTGKKHGAARKKRSAAGSNGSQRVEQCARCSAVYEAMPQCPYCGHLKGSRESKPVQIDGKLQIVTEDPRKDTESRHRA